MTPRKKATRKLGGNRDRKKEINDQTLGDSLAVANSAEYQPSERGSAPNTFPDNKNAPYRIAPTVFGHSGFTLTQLKRTGNIAIYKQTKGKRSPAYEVVIIRKAKAWTAFGKDFPAAEYYPKSEDWGTCGFTYGTIEGALVKFVELAGKRRQS